MQSYANRVAARPGYATYKNRKKELRRLHREGRIDAEQRAELQAAAKADYDTDPSSVGEMQIDRLRGILWWEKLQAEGTPDTMSAAVHALQSGALDDPDHTPTMCGAESCAGADPGASECRCACGGIFHSAAHGGPLAVDDDEVLEVLIEAEERRAG